MTRKGVLVQYSMRDIAAALVAMMGVEIDTGDAPMFVSIDGAMQLIRDLYTHSGIMQGDTMLPGPFDGALMRPFQDRTATGFAAGLVAFVLAEYGGESAGHLGQYRNMADDAVLAWFRQYSEEAKRLGVFISGSLCFLPGGLGMSARIVQRVVLSVELMAMQGIISALEALSPGSDPETTYH